MNIRINGEPQTIEPMSLLELLGILDINPARVAVERNRDIVPKREYETTLLTDGDVIEIVQFVGGG
jgi:thiamine biosynthesis protein ThiS